MTIAAISKGQQQASTQNLQHKLNELFISNKLKSDVHVEPQKIHERLSEEINRPITFPTSEEDEVTNRFQSPPIQNSNFISPIIEQKSTPYNPQMELTRPTRVAVAAATSSAPVSASLYTDDQLDYIRDFTWNMFQVVFNIFFTFFDRNKRIVVLFRDRNYHQQ